MKRLLLKPERSKRLVSTYRTDIKLTFLIKNENKIIKKLFNESFSYNKDNKFDLVEYQREVKTMLVNKIIELIIFINLK